MQCYFHYILFLVGERKRIKEIQGVKEKDKREREGGRKRSNRGEREKITKTKKFMEYYLVVLQSGYQKFITRIFSEYKVLKMKFHSITLLSLHFTKHSLTISNHLVTAT